jgi:hypothetical protein
METRSTPQDGLPVPCGTPVPKEVPSFAGDQWSLAIESVTDWPNGSAVQVPCGAGSEACVRECAIVIYTE